MTGGIDRCVCGDEESELSRWREGDLGRSSLREGIVELRADGLVVDLEAVRQRREVDGFVDQVLEFFPIERYT